LQAAVVISSGFSEMGNFAGEEEVRAVAQRFGIALVGPNCAGLVNTASKLYPTLELRPPSGRVALVSQSGALGGVVLARTREIGLGISKFISYGNGAGLTQVDFLRYLADDPQTRVVALYIESVRDGREFMDALEACCRAKPVVVIKAGRTAVGQRATASHTGALAGSDAVYAAAMRACGAVRAQSVDEMLDLCVAFSNLPLLKGERLLVVTNSGGPAVLAADRAEELGLQVSEPSPSAQARLRDFLPPQCALRNPIDLTVEGTQAAYRQTLKTLLPEYDAALAINVSTPYLDSLALARGIADGAAGSGKPLVASFLPAELVGSGVDYLEKAGVPNFSSGERAAAALAGMLRDGRARARLEQRPQARGWKMKETGPAGGLPLHGSVLEPEAMVWLRAEGLPVPPYRLAASADEAAAGCAELGYPVVMKIVSPAILHKSDVGGVRLGLRSESDVRAAFAALAEIGRERDFRGVILYPQAGAGVEVLVGMTRDAQFGPVIAFGLGGIYAEALHDVTLRIAPLEPEDAAEMVREVRAAALLRGARGKAPGDLAALEDLLVRFSKLALRCPQVEEIDLNPVFVFEQGVSIADARIILKQ
jgi:acetyltransferase